MAKNIITPEFRTTFLHVSSPYKYPDDEPDDPSKYSATALFAVDADLSDLWAEIERAAKKKWGEVPAGCRSPIRDQKEKVKYDGYGEEGKFAKFSSLHRPGIVDASNRKILPEGERGTAKGIISPLSPDDFFSGCYAIASVLGRAYEHKGSKGVSLDLINIKMVRTGERLGGTQTNPEDDFGAPTEGSAPQDSGAASQFI